MSHIKLKDSVATVKFNCGCMACDEPYYPWIEWCDKHKAAIEALKEGTQLTF